MTPVNFNSAQRHKIIRRSDHYWLNLFEIETIFFDSLPIRILSCPSTESGCKITRFYPKFQLPVKYREMKGKRVNIIDNEIFENSP
ncbi:hypothetical protein CUC04_08510 [Prevotella intermedia]|uniref:Uncharacterized protein n=1 Tax=Prevotella intermedia TaxID=28131 RepID=A0A2G9ICC3_PREIN|nr:hypothetical protein CUC04_08510 [Prevotella intermedia]